MPTVPGKKGRDIDWVTFANLLAPWAGPVFVELVHAMPKQGVSSTFKFGLGFGGILGACGALGRRVELVTPQKWKKEVLANYEERDKAAAIDFVQKHFPTLDLTPGKTRTPQDGIADAACIAYYGYQQ